MITEPGYVGIVVELPGLSFSQLEQYRQRVLPPTIPQYFCPPKVTRGRGGGGATTPWTLSPPHYNDSVSDELGGTITAKQLLS